MINTLSQTLEGASVPCMQSTCTYTRYCKNFWPCVVFKMLSAHIRVARIGRFKLKDKLLYTEHCMPDIYMYGQYQRLTHYCGGLLGLAPIMSSCYMCISPPRPTGCPMFADFARGLV